MVDYSGKLVLFLVGLALLLPLSNSAFAQQKDYGTGFYTFYSDWMSPRVAPMDSRTLYVSEYAKRNLQPREEKFQVATSTPVKQYPTGYYDFYADWMNPRVEPMETRTLYVSSYAKRNLQPREVQAQKTASAAVTQRPRGYYDFYADWMNPRVEPMEKRTLPLL